MTDMILNPGSLSRTEQSALTLRRFKYRKSDWLVRLTGVPIDFLLRGVKGRLDSPLLLLNGSTKTCQLALHLMRKRFRLLYLRGLKHQVCLSTIFFFSTKKASSKLSGLRDTVESVDPNVEGRQDRLQLFRKRRNDLFHGTSKMNNRTKQEYWSHQTPKHIVRQIKEKARLQAPRVPSPPVNREFKGSFIAVHHRIYKSIQSSKEPILHLPRVKLGLYSLALTYLTF